MNMIVSVLVMWSGNKFIKCELYVLDFKKTGENVYVE